MSGFYTAGIKKLIESGWVASDVRALLLDDSGPYVFDKDHDQLSDLVLGTNELSTLGYSRQSVSMKSLTADNVDDEVVAGGGNVVFPDLGPVVGGPSVGAVVVYFHVDGTAAADVPFFYVDENLPLVTNGEPLTVAWSPEGVVNLMQPA
jgi:hypothetical protein